MLKMFFSGILCLLSLFSLVYFWSSAMLIEFFCQAWTGETGGKISAEKNFTHTCIFGLNHIYSDITQVSSSHDLLLELLLDINMYECLM